MKIKSSIIKIGSYGISDNNMNKKILESQTNPAALHHYLSKTQGIMPFPLSWHETQTNEIAEYVLWKNKTKHASSSSSVLSIILDVQRL